MTRPRPEQRRPLGLTLIALFKAVKVVVLIAVGVGAIAAARHGAGVELERFADALRIDPDNRYLHRALAALTRTSPRMLDEIGLGSFVYAAVFAVEGTGLWLQKTWAERVTIVITLSFIPLEAYELVHRASVAKLLTLVLNVIALAYLLARAARRRRHARGMRSTNAKREPRGFRHETPATRQRA